MEQEHKILRLGTCVIAFAAALRLVCGGILHPVTAFFAREETVSFLLYLQTGRIVRLSDAPEPTEVTQPPEQTQPQATEPEPLPLSFSDSTRLPAMTYHCGYEPDLQALLRQPLAWELTGEEPTVLILHTHATESYTASPGEDYIETSAYRTDHTGYNMVSIGDYLTRLLEEAGIGVIHDRSLHDSPSYNTAYSSARSAIRENMAQYPSIRLVLDLHRDASSTENDTQLETHATVNGKDSAQLMLVIGTNAGGLYHPQWQENLALALKLHTVLETDNPGICRPISFRNERFNQDLTTGALLVEVGAAGDSHQEALTACEALAAAIVRLAEGSL